MSLKIIVLAEIDDEKRTPKAVREAWEEALRRDESRWYRNLIDYAIQGIP